MENTLTGHQLEQFRPVLRNVRSAALEPEPAPALRGAAVRAGDGEAEKMRDPQAVKL